MSNTDLPRLEKNEQLRLAREKLKARGLSPTIIGKLNRLKVIDLIYKWGYTSPTIVQILLEITKGGYLPKLTDQGLLKKIRLEAIGADIPQFIYILTNMGLAEAERHANGLIEYVELNGIKQNLVRHNLLVQATTINAMHQGVIDDYFSERMLATQDVLGQKRVDAVWIKAGIKIGVEMELTKKWERDLDDFVLKTITAISDGKYSQFIIFSDSEAIIKGYTEAIKPGVPLRVWQKNEKGLWRVEKTITVPDWLLNKVSFQLL